MSMSLEWKGLAQLALDTFEVVHQYTLMSDTGRYTTHAVEAKADENLVAVVYATSAVNINTHGSETLLVSVRYPWRTMYEMSEPTSQFLHPSYVIDKWGQWRGGLDDYHPGELWLVMRAIQYVTGCEIPKPEMF